MILEPRRRLRAFVLALLGLTSCAGSAPGGSAGNDPTATRGSSATGPGVGSEPIWSEHFNQTPGWQSPSHQNSPWISRVYTRGRKGWLSARHDARIDEAAPAIHYGHPFGEPPKLTDYPILKWRWRVGQHPSTKKPWQDLAASIYVIHKRPGLFGGGRGFKFGWTVQPAKAGTKQRGLLQIALRHDPASDRWQQERVDLCALYREHYGDCSDARILYVGVVTDADGSESVAQADYDDFELGPGGS